MLQCAHCPAGSIQLTMVFQGRNAYDMAKFGDYAEEAWVREFLNRCVSSCQFVCVNANQEYREDVRHELGVDHEPSGGVREFIGCSDAVGEAFASTGDG